MKQFPTRLVPFLLSFVLTNCTHTPNPPLTGSLLRHSMEYKNQERSFFYYLPVKTTAKPPLIFVFHSSNGSSRNIRSQFGRRFDQIADQKGAIIVYPQGFQNHWNDCRKQAPYAANNQNIDDVGFVEEMIAFFQEEHNISKERTFATGFSNGGNFAIRLALETSRIHAFAAIATGLPTEDNFDCTHSQKPVSFLLMNGTADPVNPYHGGMVSLYGLGKRGSVKSSRETIDYWRRNANITFDSTVRPIPTEDGDAIHSIHHSWKGAATLIELVSVEGGGHTIPGLSGASNPLFGPRSKEYWAAHVIYDFFERSSPKED